MEDFCKTVPRLNSQRAIRLQYVTLVWMSIECSLALVSAYRAHSAALLAFGSDSVVEVISAAVVLAHLLRVSLISEAKATRIASVLLYALALVVVVIAALSALGKIRAESSYLGLGVTSAALVIMPLLAYLKRKEARRIANRALAADSVQSATCAYLALVTLLGVAINTMFRLPWADSVCALGAVPLLLMEANSAWDGEACC